MNQQKIKPLVSIVLPVFNEHESLAILYADISECMQKHNISYELIFIDDGSSDNSLAILKSLQEQDTNITIVHFRRNFGKSAAYQAGFDAACSDIIVTLDADLQDDPHEIPLFINKIQEGYDMVVGWRHTRKDSSSKKRASRFYNRIVATLTKIPLHDFNCPFKAYRKEVLDEIEVYGEQHRYIPLLAQAKGFAIAEIKVENKARQYGHSKYGRERMLRGMLDFLTVLFITRFAKRPMHLLGTGGLIISFLGGLILACLTGAHFLHAVGLLTDSSWEMHDRPVLSLGILLLIVGVQVFSMGLIGELFISVQSKTNKNQGYSIKNIFSKNSPEK